MLKHFYKKAKLSESSPLNDSTFITLAPKSANCIVQYGPARTLVRSITLIPSKGAIGPYSKYSFLP